MNKSKPTTVSFTGEGNHQEVLDFITSKGFSVKVWNKRGRSAKKKTTPELQPQN